MKRAKKAQSSRQTVSAAARRTGARRDTHYRRLLECLNEGIWVLDRNGFTVFANGRLASMLGYSESEMKCRHVFDFVDERCTDLCVTSLQRRRQGISEDHEIELVRRDGTRICVMMRAAPLFSSRGTYDGTIAGLSDISDRRDMRVALERERQFTSSVLSVMGALVVVLDPNGRIVRFNRACETLTGYAASEVLGRVFWEFLIPPDERSAVETVFGSLTAGVFPNQYENDWITKAGVRRRIAWSNTALTDSDCRVQHVIGTGIDVTDQQRAEAELKAMHRDLERLVHERTRELESAYGQLRLAEERYRTVADFTHDWEYWESPTGEMLYVSPSCLRITGYEASAFRDDPRLTHTIIVPEDYAAWLRHREDAMAGRGAEMVEFRVVRRDGATAWIQHVCRPVTDATGRFRGIRASNRDVTRSKRLEEEALHLRRDLAHAARLTTMGELTASLAHELNQPLTAIMVNAQAARHLIEASPPDLAETRQALQEIIDNNRRAGDVIKRIRALVRKESVAAVPVDLSEIAEEILSLIQNEILVKGIVLSKELAPSLPRAMADRTQIQQVCLNLLTNAADALAEAPSPRLLRIATSQPSPDMVRLSVRDSGIGLPEDEPGRVFNPFFTTKKEGLGMGLAISCSIMESHGGRLWAENNVGGGATFHAELPIKPE